ncbi:MAG: hypothetical protein H7832_00565 [Magnetococcus sp. DMHC-6]
MELKNGSRVAVIGGGPAGSFSAYFLLKFSYLLGIDLEVDIYEPKDFSQPGAKGCNFCGGLVYASLIQFMSVEGIHLPPEVVMNAIDSYKLHTDLGHVHIPTPLQEMSIAAVYRGGGPKGGPFSLKVPVQSFDGAIFKIACEQGAHHIQERVTKLDWDAGRPRVFGKDGVGKSYDLLVGAVGVNGTGTKVFQNLGIGYIPPKQIKTFIMDVYIGSEAVEHYVGNSMHIFLLNIKGIEQGAVIPKGPFVTICYVADEVTNELTDQFFNHPEVRNCFPPGWERPSGSASCMCIPTTIIADPSHYYADRVVMVGDSGVARLFKDGIGSAYRTAKACATTAVLWGVSKDHFEKYYRPQCDSISRDNRIGHIILDILSLARQYDFVSYSILTTAREEQTMVGVHRVMSMTLYDSFSGSYPFALVLTRILKSPGFILRFFRAMIVGMMISGKGYFRRYILGKSLTFV